jgi:hypothetical protein
MKCTKESLLNHYPRLTWRLKATQCRDVGIKLKKKLIVIVNKLTTLEDFKNNSCNSSSNKNS